MNKINFHINYSFSVISLDIKGYRLKISIYNLMKNKDKTL